MNKVNRRDFIKTSALASGSLFIGFNWMGCKSDQAVVEVLKAMPKEWFTFDAYIKIGETGLITIFSQNPEIGQNIKTSMPMIVAEELDVDWKDVIVEQAPLNTDWYERQVAGGSQSIRQGWEILRNAGASVKQLLVETAAARWEADPSDCSVSKGIVSHKDGRSIGYGALAKEASQKEVPKDFTLKKPEDFTIIGKSKVNVDINDILSGQPLFGLDYKEEGMVYAVVVRPPAFGNTLESFDKTATEKINGVIDVVSFGDKIAIIAKNTWAAIKGKKALKTTWKKSAKFEDSTYHTKTLKEYLAKKSTSPRRVDGDIDKAFKAADDIIERTYEAPFLPHNCMEPMNFFANVTSEKVHLVGPIQTPKWTESRVADLLGRKLEDIDVHMTRMGGGFGRRLYGDFALEAAEISSKINKPVKVVFSREDDMLAGTYRPASAYRFKVGIKDGEITAYHLTEACFNGQMFPPMESNFPCGAIPNYRVDCHKIDSNITTGAWRAPYANFLAFAEQAFLDELSTHLQQDPIEFRLALLEKAQKNPVGEKYNYEVDKMKGVIELAVEKSNWKERKTNKGFCAYYSHNTYVAEVAEVEMVNNSPIVKKIYCAVDCGIVINPKAALNQIEGGILDGMGHAMYADFEFENGRSKSSNFHNYRHLRMVEAPEIEVHFVQSNNDPTGLGEPTLPPAGGAIANAIFAATQKRLYKQPFVKEIKVLG